jgi:hypothetical protein
MRRTIRSLPALAATLGLALLTLMTAGCAKKVAVDRIGALLARYPDGTRDSLERTPSDLVVWCDVPNLVTDTNGDYLAYRTGAGAIQGMIVDYFGAGGYQLFRRESGDGFRLFTDYVMIPYRRWADRDYYAVDTLGTTVVLPPAQLFTFVDDAPPAIPLAGYVARAVTAGVSSGKHPLTNLGQTASMDAFPGIPYRGELLPPDSLIEIRWDPVANPRLAGYWVHVYTTLLRFKEKNRSGDDAVAIGLPSPLAFGGERVMVRDLFIGYFPKPLTSYKLGSALPSRPRGSRVIVYRVLQALQPVLVRVSAVDSSGAMIATTGPDGDTGAFREEDGSRLRTFPLGAVTVTPQRPLPVLATAPASLAQETIESGVPGLTYIRRGAASRFRASR